MFDHIKCNFYNLEEKVQEVRTIYIYIENKANKI